ncbi:MAG TPA: phosphomethylpyrimidine synthase ThiC, partial [Candidatus Hydrogenedentes bacterium]|nr:phosphomethylpyrimidine synthase ThiC [Candidatus Hydrogenedentota bacterium]
MSATAKPAPVFALDQSKITRDPFPNSRKVYVQGSRPSVRVAMREIRLSPTMSGDVAEPNPPITVYDTSGPYTDPAIEIDVRRGAPPVRIEWIRERGDIEESDASVSAFARERSADLALAAVRFPRVRRILRAKPGRCVTQMHYARRGIITPEMEYIAIRENQRR